MCIAGAQPVTDLLENCHFLVALLLSNFNFFFKFFFSVVCRFNPQPTFLLFTFRPNKKGVTILLIRRNYFLIERDNYLDLEKKAAKSGSENEHLCKLALFR